MPESPGDRRFRGLSKLSPFSPLSNSLWHRSRKRSCLFASRQLTRSLMHTGREMEMAFGIVSVWRAAWLEAFIFNGQLVAVFKHGQFQWARC